MWFLWIASNAENLLDSVYQKKSQISSEKDITLTFCNINEWLLKKYLRHKIWYWNNKPFLKLNCSLRQGTFFDAHCIAVEASVCLNSVTTVFLLAKSSHFLVRITLAVCTRGSHFQFAFYRFAISQFTNYQTWDNTAISAWLSSILHSPQLWLPVN